MVEHFPQGAISRKISHRSGLAGISSACFLTLLALSPARSAEMTPDQIEKVALGANVLPTGAKVTGRAAASEIVLSTYAKSNLPDNDLKIDAVLLAKAFIEADKSVAKVTVHFFNAGNPQSFRSVVVRNTDVKAFGMGLVEQKTLLEAIDVVKGGTAANSSAQNTKIDQGVSQDVGGGHIRHTVGGISFMFPSSWSERKSARNRTGSDTVNLFRVAPPLPSAYVELKVFADSKSLKQQFESQKTSHSTARQYRAIALRPAIDFGQRGAISGLQYACGYQDHDRHTGAEVLIYERQVFFDHSGRVFKFKLHTDQSDAKLLNEAFDRLLSSVSLRQ